MIRQEIIIMDLLEWIEDNISKPLKIEDIAVKSGYSKRHLQRIFLQVTQQSLGSFIRDKKLDLAANDLIGTKQPIINILCHYGFESQQSFTRAFVKKYSIPPGTYRRIHLTTHCSNPPANDVI
ncbi:helix-turn-helix domain-containing protein [Acerihabitans arboris]|uniref:Helix-turn-helix domain-containing protein n=1 Tax=Acerihabitans arboris TaxID=2691583 RepID=A0A845SG37_9GAMM|nr:helix-turn-helix domain-containing protein [Acerihabitans arboris]NDL62036.1 helix-turn-helix domain-containing protein [Acerihabitans arboris]